MDLNAVRIAQALVYQLEKQPEVVVGLSDYIEYENVCDILEAMGYPFERFGSQMQITLHRPANWKPASVQ